MMYDAVIIGAGPSGIAAATRIAQLGGKVALIEKEKLGGVCTNWGCVPTKAMVAVSRQIFENKKAKDMGLTVSTKIDFKKVIGYRDNASNTHREAMRDILKSYKVEMIRGKGVMLNKNTVQVGTKKLSTKNIIHCTGSDSFIPPSITISKKVLTSKEFIQITQLPKRLVIIGGGVIGSEFASIFHHLGSKVTIIEYSDRLLAAEDPEIGRTLTEEFKKQGITVLTNTPVEKVDDAHVHIKGKKIPHDIVLVATGRRPIIDEEELKRVGVKHDTHGIKVNNKLQTNIKNIYSIGDNTGKSILAHVGIRQGIVAANTIMGVNDSMNYVTPRCVYTIPEVAAVGKTERQVTNPKIGTFQLAHTAKGVLDNEKMGFVKVILEKDKVVGFQMIGHEVTEMVNEAALIVANNISAKKIDNTIHPHPTMGEAIRYAIQDALGDNVDQPKKN